MASKVNPKKLHWSDRRQSPIQMKCSETITPCKLRVRNNATKFREVEFARFSGHSDVTLVQVRQVCNLTKGYDRFQNESGISLVTLLRGSDVS